MTKGSSVALGIIFSVGAGFVLFDSVTWGYEHPMTEFLEDVATLWFREMIASIALIIILCAPIGAFGKEKAAWFGLLVSVTYQAAMYRSLLELPVELRGSYSLSYLPIALAEAAIISLISFMWWWFVFKPRNTLLK